MVLLHIKRRTESQFLFETSSSTPIFNIIKEIVTIYNGRLKVDRICSEIDHGLSKHGPMLSEQIQGLTDEQIEEMKLVDQWADKIVPLGGWTFNKDPCARRNGRQPMKNMQEILENAVKEAKEMISNKNVDKGEILTLKVVQNAIAILRGAVTIVYPMELPPHDPIRMEFLNTEDLSETQAAREVIELAKAELWFAGHQMFNEKCLHDYLGRNEKSKAIVKLVKKGDGAPGREPIFDETTQKAIMLQQYRRQEELKQLADDEDDSYLDSKWANSTNLKQKLHGVEDISFRFGKM